MTEHQVDPEPIEDPLWYKDAVVYQLHLKSFFDSNDDGVGDFPGLIEKLDYVAGLGVTAIWLLPFYPSPRRDDGYDISEYRDVHPDYGTMEDVRRFVDEAHARGMRVITELVVNHTSDQHPWFQAARRAPPGSSEREFYVWSDDDKKYAGTRIIFLDAEKSNWTWDAEAGAYFWHRFYSHQPDLNYDNPDVLRALLDVLRFWFDIGVDGMRLDAAPYLVEREGTSNENLPETHQILKVIRAEVDARYADRVLLAEANMWPEDTQQYFGDDDECHMAFHFPLMPRMYMAIAQEDRFPITDIVRQTPDIPERCQWAIFLRNHDELTLEMVTNKERDYLWSVYAADRRARLNLGIRRRLAPLMERDRRRMELMHSLLLSMPGTPVLYYGDEIGMGDNVYLGDRDGVRTPMQWSPDRNGGFSKADPARLALPLIMDPLYGYEALNVEAQERDPHSLLNAIRRMLAVRKEHRAFGRGALRFLRPQNRKILAYLREHEDDLVLCVANLSRTAQSVELDLSEHAGRVPVELSGQTSFPAIGELTYLLTLPPYGIYWFELSEHASAPNWSASSTGLGPEYHTFVLRGAITDLLTEDKRAVLERDILPDYVGERRWFQGKDEAIKGVKVVDALTLPGERDQLLAEIEVVSEGGSNRYALPLGVAWEDEPMGPYAPALALSRVRRGAQIGYLTDGFATHAFAAAVVKALGEGATLPSDAGELRFLPADGFDLLEDARLEWLSAEQSNSSIVVDGRAVLKLLRRSVPGVHPEAEMTRHLTACGFPNAPPLLGEVIRVDAEGRSRTLIVVQGFVPSQGDGWSWTCNFLERALGEARAAEDEAHDVLDGYMSLARGAGRRLAEMHAVLARPSEDPAFAPETASERDVAAWTDEVQALVAKAFDTLAHVTEGPAADVLGQRHALLARIPELASAGRGSPRTRVHGDLHLGQVLVAGDDVVFIDFEGEPTKPLDARRAKHSPMRDVAGMLRSFDYAAAWAQRTLPLRSDDDPAAVAEFFARFADRASTAFLEGYALGGGALSQPLLDLFLIEKAAYEVAYEAANRPDWIDAPISGLTKVASRLTGRGPP